MEDRTSAVIDCDFEFVGQHATISCFGVFDGHGGAEAAEYASRKLLRNIVAEIQESFTDQFFTKSDSSSSSGGVSVGGGGVKFLQ